MLFTFQRLQTCDNRERSITREEAHCNSSIDGLEKGNGNAFTLIELLVVMAIVALLAALLIPTLSRAKSAAHRVRCVGNLRQIGLGMLMYVDQNEAYPRFWTRKSITLMTGGDVIENWYWNDLIEEYVGERWTNGVFRCPSYKFAQAYRNHRIDEANPTVGSYGYNGAEVRSLSEWAPTRPLNSIRPGDVLVPSEMIAVGDSNLSGRWSAVEYVDVRVREWDVVGIGILTQHRIKPNPSVAEQVETAERRRHEGIYNVLFCDGHIESIPRGNLYANNSQSLRRWNILNEPRP